jgi:hypothetical protein
MPRHVTRHLLDPLASVQSAAVHGDARVITVCAVLNNANGTQVPALFTEADLDQPVRSMSVRVLDTGNQVPDGFVYAGTAVSAQAQWAKHVYVEPLFQKLAPVFITGVSEERIAEIARAVQARLDRERQLARPVMPAIDCRGR